MKFEYKKLYVVLWLILLSITFCVVYCFAYHLFHPSLISELGSIALYIIALVLTVFEFKNKAVELLEHTVIFYSFRPYNKNKSYSNISVKYKDIYKIKAHYLPGVGIVSAYCYTKDGKVYLPKGFANEQMLFSLLVNYVLSDNPNALLDKKLSCFISKVSDDD